MNLFFFVIFLLKLIRLCISFLAFSITCQTLSLLRSYFYENLLIAYRKLSMRLSMSYIPVRCHSFQFLFAHTHANAYFACETHMCPSPRTSALLASEMHMCTSPMQKRMTMQRRILQAAHFRNGEKCDGSKI